MVEAILQSRLDVKKSLFRQFDVVLKQFESSHSAPFGENIFKFLEALIVADLYKIRQRLIITNENGEVCAKVGVTFLLIERKTGDKTEA